MLISDPLLIVSSDCWRSMASIFGFTADHLISPILGNRLELFSLMRSITSSLVMNAQPYTKVDFGSTEIAERSNEVFDLPAASVGTIDGANKRGRKGKSSAKLT
jgi:hypothetical protein